MKKLFILALTLSGLSSAMAQKTPAIVPFDNTLNGALTKPFVRDSTWHTVPPAGSANNFFKKEDIDIQKISHDQQFATQMLFNNPPTGYKMPTAVLEGNSKMPVKKFEGSSKMPVAGYLPKPVVKKDSVTTAKP